MFWIDTEGRIQEFSLLDKQTAPDGRQLYIWPSSKTFQAIAGPAGTEVVFACSGTERAPTVDDLLLGALGEQWPALPAKTLVRFDTTAITLDDVRGPVASAPLTADYLQRARELQSRLHGRVKGFSGLAFARTTTTSP